MVLRMRTKVKALPGCPMSKCMALLSGLWTPELLWSLSNGPRRFSELRRDIPAISAKVLTSRLRDLEHRGVLGRSVMPTSPPTVEYDLTPLGRELLPAIKAIVDVGSRLLLRDLAIPSPQAVDAPGPGHLDPEHLDPGHLEQ
ncbi:winged helix-turn-helix transcriptional regulator [Nguyenibacter vanlangensis]|uniref:Helix-turn-helix transcriptional regulator n=1 Tax=Nguyenibacter vanlangensis TaxID=1216886 RepID=A0A7Y7IYN3_9PROT|nr:helix-turn-helix domain-containing protein [Nguyenibacter vanlangensis]NVN12824.1 helix-turn-helix transcriptional regulator [Nguyenibacter vanlangensis]